MTAWLFFVLFVLFPQSFPSSFLPHLLLPCWCGCGGSGGGICSRVEHLLLINSSPTDCITPVSPQLQWQTIPSPMVTTLCQVPRVISRYSMFLLFYSSTNAPFVSSSCRNLHRFSALLTAPQPTSLGISPALPPERTISNKHFASWSSVSRLCIWVYWKLNPNKFAAPSSHITLDMFFTSLPLKRRC